ncbi:MAG TPA: CHAT domain-containing protein [Vicinamibacterales bacterium]|nr:CHAT domain-containing protein [Vicinamibacterales bacterium]
MPSRGPSDREVSPDVRIAAARLEKLAGEHDTAENEAALGDAALALHDFDRAVGALARAVARRPDEAEYRSDLSAAYAARAAWRNQPGDWAKALNAAEEAIAIAPTLAPACFNRAVALEGLHLTARASEAWATCAAMDDSSGWAKEAARRAKLPEGRSRVAEPGEEFQTVREHIEDDLFLRWATAERDGRSPDARKTLDEASRLASSLAAQGGDGMAADEARLIERETADGHRAALANLAAGHVLFAQARHLFLRDRLEEAARAMSAASRHFERVGSPYGSWGRVYRAILARVNGEPDAALRLLADARADSVPPSYLDLAGRLAWTRAIALETSGRFDPSRRDLQRSIDLFHDGREIENESAVSSHLAELEWFMGNSDRAWTLEIEALTHVDALGRSTRQSIILFDASLFCDLEHLPRAAMYFENALVRLGDGAPKGPTDADVLLERARTRQTIGDVDGSRRDLQAAAAVAGALDPDLRTATMAHLHAAEAALLATAHPERAITHATEALAYLRHADVAGIAELLMVRASARRATGDLAGARQDLYAAVDAFEAERNRLDGYAERMRAFENERASYRQLVGLELSGRDTEPALTVSELGRTRGFAATGTWFTAIDPRTAYTTVPRDTAVIYMVQVSGQVHVWVLTHATLTSFSWPIAASDLAALTGRLRASIDAGATFSAIEPLAAAFTKSILEPALRLGGRPSTLVFVPDGPLANIPWAALPDDRGAPLLTAFTIVVAPSLSSFLSASARLRGFHPDDVMAIGDGHDPAASGLPWLPSADEEAADVRREYPSGVVLAGRDAQRARFFAHPYAVIHFAGHSVLDPAFPPFSRLLLAPSPGETGNQDVYGVDVIRHAFKRTGVVVLASCEAAAGRAIDGEGIVSLSTMFLRAGVPSVVASLWPVSDAAHPLFVAFHRELRRSGDPAAALRTVQQAFLSQHGMAAPVREWGGLVALGGMKPSGN